MKIRHTFKERMRESAKLYDEEQHAMRLARRLQEQNEYYFPQLTLSDIGANTNSQLLELLLDVNESIRLSPSLRYDLRSPTPNATDVPALEPDLPPRSADEVEGARAALREARYELEAGQISRADYNEHEAALSAIINGPQIQDAPKSLANLSKVTHTELSSVDPITMPSELLGESPTGYLTPAREDEVLDKLDTFLASAPSDAQVPLPRQPKPTDKEREKDAQLHNPVSVYNWLKNDKEKQKEKHQPYPHDLETDAHASSAHNSEPPHKSKPSPKPPSSSGATSTKPTRKRASSSLVPKAEPEEEILDEDGTVLQGGGEALDKKKRKRENDDAYRPKGGSSRARKRTKGSSGAVVKKIEEEEDEGV